MRLTAIGLPLSKSIAIRKLMVHYIRYGKLLEVPGNQCSDICIVQTILQQMLTGRNEEMTILDAQDCGAAFRFITAMAAATPGEWLITGTPRLLSRPIAPLIKALQSVGADIQEIETGLLVHGKTLSASKIQIDCTQSSQFGSALLLAAPLMGNPEIQTFPPGMPSAGYFAMTKSIVQEINHPSASAEIESDWSGALYWYAYALLHPTNEYLLKGLKPNSLQPDSVIADWFELWGVHTEFVTEGTILSPNGNNITDSQHIDLENNIDCAPILAVTALLYPFELTLNGIKNLNKKESPRRDIIIAILSQVTEIKNITADSFTICKRNNPLPERMRLASHHDHRFVLAWSLLKGFTEVAIDDEKCVNKSYPGFSAFPNR